jgi:hypothetical protein
MLLWTLTLLGALCVRYARAPTSLCVSAPVLVRLSSVLQESLGTVATTKSAYERCIDLKVATPQMIINYATYLEDKGYFEDSFKARLACVLVHWPVVSA